MKRFLIFLALLLIPTPSYGTYWYEFAHKSYIDLDSVSEYQYTKRAWLKLLNPGDWELINNKKIWFEMEYVEVICSNQAPKYRPIHYTAYDLNYNVLKTWEYNDAPFTYVVPGSVGASRVKAICDSPDASVNKKY